MVGGVAVVAVLYYNSVTAIAWACEGTPGRAARCYQNFTNVACFARADTLLHSGSEDWRQCQDICSRDANCTCFDVEHAAGGGSSCRTMHDSTAPMYLENALTGDEGSDATRNAAWKMPDADAGVGSQMFLMTLVLLSIIILWLRSLVLSCVHEASCTYGLFVVVANAAVEIILWTTSQMAAFGNLQQTVFQGFAFFGFSAAVTYQGLAEPLYTHSAWLSWADSRWGMLCMLMSAADVISVATHNPQTWLPMTLFVLSSISFWVLFVYAAFVYVLWVLPKQAVKSATRQADTLDSAPRAPKQVV